MIHVIPVESRRDADLFDALPHRLYAGDPHWTPPLRADERDLWSPSHPFWGHARAQRFVAFRAGAPVGRIAAIHNARHREFHRDGAGFWGFFDVADDADGARALLEHAEDWLRRLGCDVARGPCNPSTNETAGLLVEGHHDAPAVEMTYHPPHVRRLVETAGYRGVMDLLAWRLEADRLRFDRFERVVERLRERRRIVIRPVNLRDYDAEVERVLDLYNRAWERNWGFVPMTPQEFRHAARRFRPLLRPHLNFVAEHEGRPVGFAMAVPDIAPALRANRGRLLPFGWVPLARIILRPSHIRVVALGVLPEARAWGVGPMLYLEYFRRGIAAGIRSAEVGWILETNAPMNKPIAEMGGRLVKRYRIYERPLRPPAQSPYS